MRRVESIAGDGDGIGVRQWKTKQRSREGGKNPSDGIPKDIFSTCIIGIIKYCNDVCLLKVCVSLEGGGEKHIKQ